MLRRRYAFVLLMASTATCIAGEDVRVLVRAFIPSGTETAVAGRCFMTDDRTFSSSALASSRLSTEFVLAVDGDQVKVRQASGRSIFRAGESMEMDCTTRSVLARRTANVAGMKTGEPAFYDGVVQVFFSASASNPLTPPVLSPRIDYDGAVTWDVGLRRLKMRLTVGRFPAFEAYVQRDGGALQTVLQVQPDAEASPFSLYDFGAGIGSRSYEIEIKL